MSSAGGSPSEGSHKSQASPSVTLSAPSVSYQSPEEVELERQYKEYRAQFETWKVKNKHLESTSTYKQYVQQFVTWEAEVEKRRAAIRAKKAARAEAKRERLSNEVGSGSPKSTKGLAVQTGTLPPHIQHQVQAAAQKQLELHQRKLAQQAAAAAAAVSRKPPPQVAAQAAQPRMVDHSLSQMSQAVASGVPLPQHHQYQPQPQGPQGPPEMGGDPAAMDPSQMMGMMMGMMGMMMQVMEGKPGAPPPNGAAPPPAFAPPVSGPPGPGFVPQPQQLDHSLRQANGFPAPGYPPQGNGFGPPQVARDRAARAERSRPEGPLAPVSADYGYGGARGMWNGLEKEDRMFRKWGHRADAPDKCPPPWDPVVPPGWVRGEPIRKEPRPAPPPPNDYRGGRPAFRDFSMR